MKRLFIIVFCIVGLVVNSYAQEKISVGVIESEPLAYKDALGQAKGIHYDLVAEITKKAGFTPDIQILPKARLIAYIKSGEIDAGVFFGTPDVAQQVVSAGIIDKVPFVAITKKGIAIINYEDLYKSNSISMMPNTVVTPQFDGDKKLKKVTVNNYETLAKLFVGNRTDTILGNAWILAYQLKKNGYQEISREQLFKFKDIPNELFISKQSKILKDRGRLTQAIAELDKKGTLRAILLNYTGDAAKLFK